MVVKSDERASDLACNHERGCDCPACSAYLAWTNRRRVEVLDAIIGLMVEEEPQAQIVTADRGSVVMVDGEVVE